ncbi:hypothetical protein DITRI_Ditri06bG0009300 [Diplodiscus trichospermus]
MTKLLQVYKEARVNPPRIDQRYDVRWCPAPNGSVKINVDAGIKGRTGVGQLAAVVRDSTGNSLICATKSIGNIFSPFHAEIQALDFGLKIAKTSNYQVIVVESDSKLAISEVMKADQSLCMWQGLLFDISRTSMSFRSCMFSHVKRNANRLAHELTRVQMDYECDMFWYGGMPPNLCNPDDC